MATQGFRSLRGVAVKGVAVLLLVFCSPARGDEVLVAVASNFAPVLEKLAPEFRKATGHEIKWSSASTAKLFAQAQEGAPFDVFLSADREHVERLIEAGLARASSRSVYCRGRLALWHPRGTAQPQGAPRDEVPIQDLLARLPEAGKVSIAKPELAPLGRAAREFLEARGLWKSLESRLVYGESVAQAFQFVETGAAAWGLVSGSQILALPATKRGRWAWVPEKEYAPILQEAVVLKRSKVAAAAGAFVFFLKGQWARALLKESGYLDPQP